MTPAEDFSVLPPFEVRTSAEQRVPFVFNSPHSGRCYPERFLAMTRLDSTSIRRSEDCYVDELFGAAVALGAPMLTAHFPRAYLDVNREPWELDPRMFAEPVPPFANVRSARVAGGLGTVPKLVGEGLDIYPGRLPLSEAVDRIECVYKPYHETLKRLVTRTHARFGYAVLVDCHSMPASVRIGDSGMRPDFIVGDRFGTSAASELSERAIGLLAAMGYTVAHNKPYAGGFITEHYGRPARKLHALQIEINRGLYMDERTFQKSAGFYALADDLARFSADLMAVPDHHFLDLPLAAE
ncbi:N-formylglutamate amidohydrolase [Aminobacter sp. P9b]|uniref:N-formylglutamate amidohydrolase n=1 Tax=Aminobacter niigataensis TaxID=83265 RepID=A0ABR6L9T3_9HYPH|nr:MULTISPECIES: N-formylglutamate amidohydrolase [Aminobacter]AWC22666.1 N-formylglutamate deformylase [Aminobacter sp. MSH1]MBB4652755.1 N-formylglutamate amidohydrolase [Aminobacter niigataensis]CAI2933283.1 N-formylglutamate deformylase [Aminobacter niigataensis]